MQRANQQGRGYQPLANETEIENPEEGEIEPQHADTETDSVILREDSLPILDWSVFNTDGKETHYIQINHIVAKMTGNKKNTEETFKKAEFEFMFDTKSLISKPISTRNSQESEQA